MKSITVKVNDASQTLAQTQVITKDGKPTIIKATKNVNYELINDATKRAPDHIVTKRVGKDLHVSFEENGNEADLIIEGFYDSGDSALIGLAEDGQYYYYVPDTGNVADYVTQLVNGDIEGQALGGNAYPSAWWIGATEGTKSILPWLVGLAGLVAVGAALADDDDDDNSTTAPTTETVVLSGLSVANLSNSDSVVIKGNVTINGQNAPEGTTVDITLPNGKTIPATVGKNGEYSVTVNDTESLDALKQGPKVTASKDGAEDIFNLTPAPTINPVSKTDTTITGTAEPNSEVTVKDKDGNELGKATTDANGKWSLPAPAGTELTSGEDLTATATKDGNPSLRDDEIVTPPKPTINPVDEVSPISGTAEPNQTVKVTFPGGTTATTTSDDKGNWNVPNPGLNKGDTVTAEAIVTVDGKEVKSEPQPENVIDNIPPSAPQINPVKDGDTTVSGTAEPNSKVTLTDKDGNPIGETTTDDKGNWTVTVDTPLKEGDKVKAIATDTSGNPSKEAEQPVVHTDAPNAPDIKPIADDNKPISGTAEPGSKVTVTFPDGTTATTTADDKGSWSVPNPDLKPGDKVTATATDESGNKSPQAEGIVNDVTPPKQPVINGVKESDSTVTGTAEPDSQVTVTFPDGTTATTTTDKDGNWSVPANPSVKNGGDITATAKDESGNTSTEAKEPIVDDLAPPAPSVNPITEGNPITGTAEPGSTVTVKDKDGNTIGTATTDDNGNWTIPANPGVKTGDEITATTTDESGNTSSPTKEVVIDDKAPSEPNINPIKDGDTTITGTAEPNSTVKIDTNGDGTPDKTVTADDKGNWTATVDTPLKEGDKVTATATDKAGNTSKPAEEPVVGATAPNQPDILPIDADKDTPITGTAEPGSTVTVTFPDGTTATTKADDKGNWSVPNPGLKPGEKVTATAKDDSGKESSPAEAVVNGDITPPAKPTVEVSDDGKTITGTAEPNSTVEIDTNGDGKPDLTTVADKDGNYTATPTTPLTNGETVTAIAKDTAGNASEPATTIANDSQPTTTDINDEGNTVTVTGAKPGDTVTVKDPATGDTIGTGTVQPDGTATIPLDKPIINGETVPVTVGTEEKPVTAPDHVETNTSINQTGDTVNVIGATPGDTVTVKDPTTGETIGTGTVGKDGTATIPLDKPITDGSTIPVIVGKEDKPVTAPDVNDKTKPDIDATRNPDNSVTGTTEPNTAIVDKDGNPITDKNGNPIVSDKDGNFTIPADKVPADNTIGAKDPSGNIGTDTVSPADTKAPSAPDSVVIGNGDDYIIADEIGTDGKVTATVDLPADAKAGDTVVVNGVEKVLTNDDITAGKVDVKVDAPKEGEKLTTTATIKDAAGNESAAKTDEATRDTKAPSAPDSVVIGNGDDYITAGEIGTDGKVTATVDLPADAKAGDTVVVNGVEKVLTNDDITAGKVDVKVDAPKEGEKLTTTATIKDAAGNESAAKTDEATRDTKAPSAPDSVVIGNGDDYITAKEIGTDGKVTATVDLPADAKAGDTVVVNGVEKVLTNDDITAGKVDVKVDAPKEGEKLTTTATIKDAAGNESAAKTDEATRDTKAPSAPDSVVIGNGDDYITAGEIGTDGKVTATVDLPADAKAGDTVVVNGVEKVLTNDDITAGKVDVKVDAPKEGEKLTTTATIKDAAGNESAAKTDEATRDTKAPSAPDSVVIGNGDDYITAGEIGTDGKVTATVDLPADAKAGDTVVVNGVEKVLTNDDITAGKVDVKVDAPKEGEKLTTTATIKDAAGNESAAKTDEATRDTKAPSAPDSVVIGNGDDYITAGEIGTDGKVTATVDLPADAKAGDTVVVNGVEKVLTNDDITAGKVDVKVDAPKEGEKLTTTATIKDAAGNESAAKTDEATRDTKAPSAPDSVVIGNGDDYITAGEIGTDGKVTATVDLPADAKAGDTVVVNGVEKVLTNDDITAGKVDVKVDAPKEGEKLTTTATIKDAAGNESAAKTDEATRDTKAPSAPDSVVIGNGDDYITAGEIGTDGKVTATVDLPADAKAGDTVVVNGVEKVLTNDDITAGKVDVKVDAPKEGEKLTTTATIKDAAGNESAAKTDEATRDTKAPSAPDSVVIGNGDDYITAGEIGTDGKVTATVDLPADAKAGDTVVVNGVKKVLTNDDITAGKVDVKVDAPKEGEKLTTTATIKDAAGNESAAKTDEATRDTKAPSAPDSVVIGNGDDYITAGEIGTDGKVTATVDLPADAKAGDTVVVNGVEKVLTNDDITAGKVDVKVDAPKEGEKLTTTATIKDAAGNESAAKTDEATRDTKAPSAPDSVVIGNGDDYITAGEIGTDGKVTATVDLPADAKAGDTVVVNGVEKVLTNDDITAGKVDVKVDAPKEGEKLTTTATIKDAAGNESAAKTDEATRDTKAPSAPDSVVIGNGDDYITAGEIGTDGKVTATVDLPADAKAGDTVVVNGVEKVLTNDDITAGKVDVKVDAPKEGEKLTTTATIKDAAGNESAAKTDEATRDTKAPSAPDSVVIGNGDDYITAGEIGTDGKVTATVDLPADAKAGDTVVVNGVEKVLTNDDITAGKVDVKVDAPKEGEKLTTTATIKDAAGNESAAKTDEATRDTKAPDATTTQINVNKIAGDDIINATEAKATTLPVSGKVTGEFKAGDQVTVTVNGKDYTTTVKADGAFTADVNTSDLVADSDTVADVKVAATDAAGNVGEVTTTKDYSVNTKPGALTIVLEKDTGASNRDNITNDGTVIIKGIEKGATVEYRLDNGASWTTVTGDRFELPNNSTEEGVTHNIQVRQTLNSVESDVSSKTVTYDTVSRLDNVFVDKKGTSLIVRGVVEEGSTVKVAGKTATVTGNNFEVELPNTSSAQMINIDIKSIDKAGNVINETYSVRQVPNVYRNNHSSIQKDLNDNANILIVGENNGYGDVGGLLLSSLKSPLKFGAGDDSLVAAGAIQYSSTEVRMGDGDDTVRIKAYVRGGAKLYMEDGDDLVVLGDPQLGTGRDLTISGLSIADSGSLVDLGNGNDVVELYAGIANSGSLVGGLGLDTLRFTNKGVNQDLSFMSGMEMIDLTGAGNNRLNLTIKDVLQNVDTATVIDGTSYTALFINGNAGDTVDLGDNGGRQSSPNYGGFVSYTQPGPDGYIGYWNGSDKNTLVFIQDTITII